MQMKKIVKALEPVHLRFTVPGELYQEILLYQEYNAEKFNEEKLLIPDLLSVMTAMFVGSDKGFLAWKKEHGKMVAQPTHVAIAKEKKVPKRRYKNGQYATGEERIGVQ